MSIWAEPPQEPVEWQVALDHEDPPEIDPHAARMEWAAERSHDRQRQKAARRRLWKAKHPWTVIYASEEEIRAEAREWEPFTPHPDDEVEIAAAELAIEDPGLEIAYC